MTTRTKINVTVCFVIGAGSVTLLAERLNLSSGAEFLAYVIQAFSLIILFWLIYRMKLEQTQKEVAQPPEVVQSERARRRMNLKRFRTIQFIGIIIIASFGPYWMPFLNPKFQPIDCLIGSIGGAVLGLATVWYATRKRLRELE
jgi:amino acid transporter